MNGNRSKKDLICQDDDAEGEASGNHLEEDLNILDEFCNSFGLEEISFEKFCEANNSLDIQMSLSLTDRELNEGGTKQLSYTRSYKANTPNGVRLKKEKVIVEVKWDPGTPVGEVIRIENKGDKGQDDQIGDLILIVKTSQH